MATIQDYRNEQLEKLEALKKLGVNPYPVKSRRTVSVGELLKNFDIREGNEVVVSGRIFSIRTHGRLNFIDIEDGLEKIQLVFKDGDIENNYTEGKLAFGDVNLLTRGDFIEAAGTVGKSKTGQESIMVSWYAVVSKALRPMPEELTDKEARFRRRYLDMAVNKNVRERFLRRSKFWQATRDFLNKEGFTEINIPVLEHTTGGADAKPFVTHMEALDQDYYLRISHELPLKRLLGAGFERVYDIGPRFRNEHISEEHLPEHIAMESYAAYQNYDDAMRFYERMIQYVAQETWGSLTFENANGFEVDLSRQWPIKSYPNILKEEFGVDIFNPDREQLLKILKDNNVELETEEVSDGRLLDNVWKLVRRKSAGPYWMIHEPVTISPLAKADPKDERLALRFHPVFAGSEMANAFAELNDPQDQLARFKEQQAMRDKGDDEAQMLDIDFVEMLEYAMPPATGWGHSERLFWLLEGVSAREGVPFPHMRFELDENTKNIYDL